MSKTAMRSIALLAVIVGNLLFAPPGRTASRLGPATSGQEPHPHAAHLSPVDGADGFVRYMADGEAACREATPDEMATLFERDPDIELHTISPLWDSTLEQQTAGLTIVLRGTAQLETFPLAKAAFLRAAQTWQAVIQNQITVVLDVDFGPTRFGTPFGNGVLGATSSQTLGSDSLYGGVRQALNAGASTPQEVQLYSQLPGSDVPTDIGNTTAMASPSSVLRALGIISPVANPSSEQGNFGNPPAIGFNSTFNFDFDPSDGIDLDKIDFDGVAVHEIGHALGFTSNAGLKELIPSNPISPSVWDLFRFRPGTPQTAFATAQRVMSSGGVQVFYAGGSEVALSTGRPNGQGGDGRQASHWKDEDLSGQYIGIMDPTSGFGERNLVTTNDLVALEAMGYRVTSTVPPPPPPPELTEALSSGVMRTGTLSVPSSASTLGLTQYTIQVPAGASQLTVDLNATQDLDLFVRFNQRVTAQTGPPQADHSSASQSGVEVIAITPSSQPPLRQGVYYIALRNSGSGAANFSLTATVSQGPVGGGGDNLPSISRLEARLEGDLLNFAGTASDVDGDIAQAQVNLLNGSNSSVGQTSPIGVNFGSFTTINFTLQVSNLSQFPTAMKAQLVLIDQRGNRSAPIAADFSQADAGGPTVSSASFSGSKMKIKGKEFDDPLQVEINGLIVAPPVSIGGGSKKVTLKGAANRLNIRSGPNRVRVRSDGLWSNIRVLDF